MDSGRRYRTNKYALSTEDYIRALSPSNIPETYYSTGVWWPRASRLVHKLLRIPPPPQREERPKLRAVADQRPGPSVGEPVETYPFLEVLRESRLQDLGRRS